MAAASPACSSREDPFVEHEGVMVGSRSSSCRESTSNPWSTSAWSWDYQETGVFVDGEFVVGVWNESESSSYDSSFTHLACSEAIGGARVATVETTRGSSGCRYNSFAMGSDQTVVRENETGASIGTGSAYDDRSIYRRDVNQTGVWSDGFVTAGFTGVVEESDTRKPCEAGYHLYVNGNPVDVDRSGPLCGVLRAPELP